MYANNMLSFLREIVTAGDGSAQLSINVEDEVQKGAMIAHGGSVTNAMVASALGAPASA
jgi:NAD/NADP transhydrogenase alpha subunit